MSFPKNNYVVDLSHWNTVTDFAEVADAGVLGVVHKFSQGAGYKDTDYKQRCRDALDIGLRFGRYHFADNTNVQQQVTNFLTDWTPGELLALDWEDLNPQTMTLMQAVEFVEEVEMRTGVVPVLYSGNTLKEALKGTANAALSRCRLWLPQYGPEPVCPPGWTKPWLWQFTEDGRIEGIEGAVDLDAYDGAPEDLMIEWSPRMIA
jgi:lysozyme